MKPSFLSSNWFRRLTWYAGGFGSALLVYLIAKPLRPDPVQDPDPVRVGVGRANSPALPKLSGVPPKKVVARVEADDSPPDAPPQLVQWGPDGVTVPYHLLDGFPPNFVVNDWELDEKDMVAFGLDATQRAGLSTAWKDYREQLFQMDGEKMEILSEGDGEVVFRVQPLGARAAELKKALYTEVQAQLDNDEQAKILISRLEAPVAQLGANGELQRDITVKVSESGKYQLTEVRTKNGEGYGTYNYLFDEVPPHFAHFFEGKLDE